MWVFYCCANIHSWNTNKCKHKSPSATSHHHWQGSVLKAQDREMWEQWTCQVNGEMQPLFCESFFFSFPNADYANGVEQIIVNSCVLLVYPWPTRSLFFFGSLVRLVFNGWMHTKATDVNIPQIYTLKRYWIREMHKTFEQNTHVNHSSRFHFSHVDCSYTGTIPIT